MIVATSAGLGLFYTQYVAFLSWFMASTVATILFLVYEYRRRYIWQFIKRWSLCTLIIGVTTTPWILAQNPLGGGGEISLGNFSEHVKIFLDSLWVIVLALNISGLYPVILMILGFISIVIQLYRRQRVGIPILISTLLIIHFVLKSIFTSVSEVVTSFVSLRYFSVTVPWLFIAQALLIADIWKKKKLIAITVAILLLGSNVLSTFHFESPFLKLISEMHSPYVVHTDAIAKLLEEKARDGDTVFLSLDRDHDPLLFRLKKTLKFVERISPTHEALLTTNRDILAPYIYKFDGKPDWVILFSQRGDDGTFYTFDYREPPSLDYTREYREHIIPLFFSDLTRPEIPFHRFRKLRQVETRDYVYIYERLRP